MEYEHLAIITLLVGEKLCHVKYNLVFDDLGMTYKDSEKTTRCDRCLALTQMYNFGAETRPGSEDISSCGFLSATVAHVVASTFTTSR